MELKSPQIQIKQCLDSLGDHPAHSLEGFDDEILEVLAGVSWVREALAQAAPNLPPDDQREVLFGLKSLAA
jgi:hypothetical protein